MPNTKAVVSGDFSSLISGAQNAAKSVADLGLKLSGIGVASKGFDVLTGAVGTATNALAKIGQAALGLEAMGRSAIAMGNGLLKGNANLEMVTISFKTLLGSAGAAQDMIKQLTAFAQATPFELAGLESNTQRLLAFGFEAKDIIPLMTSMGDAIAALGGTQDNLNSLVYVMGQMRAEAHLNAGDIMQMTNLGIPALQMLADHYKVTTGEMQTMISKGLVPGKDAVDIFTTGLEQRYGGMMAAQSATFSGMISNLQDWAHATTITLTKPFFEPAKQALAAFLNFVQSPAGEAAINKLAEFIQLGVDKVTGYFQQIEPKIKPTLDRVITGFDTFYKKIQPIAAKVWEVYQAVSPLSIAFDVISGILNGGVQGGLDALQEHLGKVGSVIGDLVPQILTGLSTVIPQVLQWITDQAPKIFEQLGKWGESFGKLVDKVMPPLLATLGKVINGVFDWITKNGPSLLDKLMEWAGKFGEWAKNAIPIMLTKLGDLINTLLGWLGDHAPEILGALGEWAGKFVEWAAGLIAQIYPKLGEFTQKLWDWIGEQAPGFADKLMEWAGAFVNWIITQAVPNVIQMLPKIWLAVMKFIGEIELNIVKEIGKWTGAFLGWVWDVVRQLPGQLWNIITGIGSWIGSMAGKIAQVAGDIGGAVINGIITAIHDAPGKIWDAVTGVLGNGAVNIIKGVVQAVANFFVDVVNTPINLLNTIVDTLHGIDIFGAKPFEWIPKIPKLGYLSFASGTMNAPGGLSLVGEQGMELIRMANSNLMMLATRPMLLDLPRGSQIYNNQQTRNLLPSPASPQQISNMYATSYANRSYDNSTSNSNNYHSGNTNNYYVNGQQANQWSFGQQMKWVNAR